MKSSPLLLSNVVIALVVVFGSGSNPGPRINGTATPEEILAVKTGIM